MDCRKRINNKVDGNWSQWITGQAVFLAIFSLSVVFGKSCVDEAEAGISWIRIDKQNVEDSATLVSLKGGLQMAVDQFNSKHHQKGSKLSLVLDDSSLKGTVPRSSGARISRLTQGPLMSSCRHFMKFNS